MKIRDIRLNTWYEILDIRDLEIKKGRVRGIDTDHADVMIKVEYLETLGTMDRVSPGYIRNEIPEPRWGRKIINLFRKIFYGTVQP